MCCDLSYAALAMAARPGEHGISDQAQVAAIASRLCG
jgi:hypothetical protein